MEKIRETRKSYDPNQNQQQHQRAKSLVWDCGSSLYDSFELKSFQRQLDSALHSRTLSMPHLPDRKLPPPAATKKPSNKISRSVNKFLKTLFRSKQNSSSTALRVQDRPHDEYLFIYDKNGALTTIPEASEVDFGGFSPKINSFERRTKSERFSAPTSIGISCV